MTAVEYAARWPFDIDRLRHITLAFSNVTESFNQRWSTDQLMKLHRAWMIAECDIPPDHWTSKQVRQALRGIVPRWDDFGRAL